MATKTATEEGSTEAVSTEMTREDPDEMTMATAGDQAASMIDQRAETMITATAEEARATTTATAEASQVVGTTEAARDTPAQMETTILTELRKMLPRVDHKIPISSPPRCRS